MKRVGCQRYNCHFFLMSQEHRPHPEEHRKPRRLEGWPQALTLVAHSAFAPESFTIRDHLVSSRSISAAYSSGVLDSGSAPAAAKRVRTSSEASAAVSSALSRWTIGRGVPAGATIP